MEQSPKHPTSSNFISGQKLVQQSAQLNTVHPNESKQPFQKYHPNNLPENREQAQNQKAVSSLPPVEILRHQNYSIRRLLPKDKQDAVHLLAKQFADQQPIYNAYVNQFVLQSNYLKLKCRQSCSEYKKSPSKRKLSGSELSEIHKFEEPSQKSGRAFMQQLKYSFLLRDFSYWILNAIDSLMSVGVFDLSNNEKLVGVSIVRDFSYVAPGFEQAYMRDMNFLSAINGMEEVLIQKAAAQHQAILKNEAVMDIMLVSIDKSHMGKNLLAKMMSANQYLGRLQGYRFSLCYATNFKTGIALGKQHYTKIFEIDSKEFELKGVKPFATVEETQRISTIWLKKLQQ